MIIEYRATGRLGGTAMTLIVINLVWGFAFNGLGGNISIGGHIGGLIGGILVIPCVIPNARKRSAAIGLIVPENFGYAGLRVRGTSAACTRIGTRRSLRILSAKPM